MQKELEDWSYLLEKQELKIHQKISKNEEKKHKPSSYDG
jgi:hypothetical protein